ncbi:hypothetical protein CPB85DRAFT_1334554 [Mucidula mucida]|nr:hypothetical protein CPB85DRAFT_1334554 [Mucidula mucida]
MISQIARLEEMMCLLSFLVPWVQSIDRIMNAQVTLLSLSIHRSRRSLVTVSCGVHLNTLKLLVSCPRCYISAIPYVEEQRTHQRNCRHTNIVLLSLSPIRPSIFSTPRNGHTTSSSLSFTALTASE